MASIRFRTHKWQCRIQRQGFPILSKAFDTKEDALRWSRGIERSMDLGEYTSAEYTTTTLTDLLDRYEKEVTPSKRGAAQEKYRLVVIRKDKIASLNIKSITSAEVAAFRDRRLSKVNPQCKECAGILRELFGDPKKIQGLYKWRIPLKAGKFDKLLRDPIDDDDKY